MQDIPMRGGRGRSRRCRCKRDSQVICMLSDPGILRLAPTVMRAASLVDVSMRIHRLRKAIYALVVPVLTAGNRPGQVVLRVHVRNQVDRSPGRYLARSPG
jgi:hypothetical protein